MFQCNSLVLPITLAHNFGTTMLKWDSKSQSYQIFSIKFDFQTFSGMFKLSFNYINKYNIFFTSHYVNSQVCRSSICYRYG